MPSSLTAVYGVRFPAARAQNTNVTLTMLRLLRLRYTGLPKVCVSVFQKPPGRIWGNS